MFIYKENLEQRTIGLLTVFTIIGIVEIISYL